MGKALELVQCDISESTFALPGTDLLIANLIIEYVGQTEFVLLIDRNRNQIEVVSCTIQKNQEEGFVSQSTYTSAFDPLLSIFHDADANTLIALFHNKNEFIIDLYENDGTFNLIEAGVLEPIRGI